MNAVVGSHRSRSKTAAPLETREEAAIVYVQIQPKVRAIETPAASTAARLNTQATVFA
jgi:hypothetical protein